ncbi:hypothetical protein H2198_005901 [Neophaeococcomyces mojaviensis]|uniref:Uncharacterized protein n=1 Tax=Neophaeococcomyces mojaviensis TaxID=3383035 RepID=A0ACC3A4G1_9EURO|nr:hypothetical protein H2198_005901 [Knufia sp. JES_112]
MNAAEPSGNCVGTATFTSRQPSIFVDGDGKLQNASKEMLYAEKGEFEMMTVNSATNVPRFSFSRKYVWRFQEEKAAKPEISIWFVKPGTEQIDYLFHTFHVQNVSKTGDSDNCVVHVECSGGHLCVEDFYSSNYAFAIHDQPDGETEESILKSWNMLHEVRGPKKDQVIETTFTRA